MEENHRCPMDNGRVKDLKRDELEDVIGEGLVLLDFYAEWCLPCIKMEAVLERIAEEFEGKIKVCRFNVEEDEDLVDRFYIQILPTLFLLKDGEILAGIEGVAELKSIEKLIKNVLS
jgi:thioredoxin 1